MTTLPSPPLNALSPEPSYALHHYAYHPIDPAMKALLASSLRVMDQVSPSATTGAHTSSLLTLLNKQPPPPTLREILEAYKARGDGDREMLLAMLNAKSSEDQVSPPVTYATARLLTIPPLQRLASLATLHRTLMDAYQAPHLQAVPPVLAMHDSHHGHSYSHPHHFPSPPASYHHSPHETAPPPLHDDHARLARHRTSSPPSASEHRNTYAPSSPQSRKRRRSSRSPAPLARARASPAHSQDLPPSPYSSAASSSAQSSGGSPRSREPMAINSLHLTSQSRDEDVPRRHTSAERSTSMGSRER